MFSSYTPFSCDPLQVFIVFLYDISLEHYPAVLEVQSRIPWDSVEARRALRRDFDNTSSLETSLLFRTGNLHLHFFFNRTIHHLYFGR